MCQQFRFENKSQFRVFLAKPQKAADLKLFFCTVYVTIYVYYMQPGPSPDRISGSGTRI